MRANLALGLVQGILLPHDRPHERWLRELGYADARTAAGDRAMLAKSEEHTSELQSLMRISYAVFCLKKKNITTHTDHNSRLYNTHKYDRNETSLHNTTI